MSEENLEKYLEIINTIGISKVEELYNKLGAEKISMAMLKKVITHNSIEGDMKANKSVANVAADNGVSRMTIYRAMHKK